MATRYGWQTYSWLQMLGWRKGKELPEDQFDDPLVTDPVTGEDDINVYEAVKRQKERTGQYPEFLK